MEDENGRTALAVLHAAAEQFGRPEINRIAMAVVSELRSRSPIGIFGDVAARDWWDEYCWSLQYGPYDQNWDDIVRAFVDGELEKLPKHILVFLSALAFSEGVGSGGAEDGFDGGISMDDIQQLVMNEINYRAGQRNLDLIGPHRGDAIGYEIEGQGAVWSALSHRDEAMDLISTHTDAMLNPDADLSEAASELAEAFLAAAEEDGESILPTLLSDFRAGIRTLLITNDVLPALQSMRKGLLQQLDG